MLFLIGLMSCQLCIPLNAPSDDSSWPAVRALIGTFRHLQINSRGSVPIWVASKAASAVMTSTGVPAGPRG